MYPSDEQIEEEFDGVRRERRRKQAEDSARFEREAANAQASGYLASDRH